MDVSLKVYRRSYEKDSCTVRQLEVIHHHRPHNSKKIMLLQLCIDGDDIYWSELRPLENGPYAIMRHTPDGNVSECIPPEYSARSKVHEYGGGAFTVHKGVIYFINFKDQHL